MVYDTFLFEASWEDVFLLPTSLREKELSKGSKPLGNFFLSMRMTLEYQLALNKKKETNVPIILENLPRIIIIK